MRTGAATGLHHILERCDRPEIVRRHRRRSSFPAVLRHPGRAHKSPAMIILNSPLPVHAELSSGFAHEGKELTHEPIMCGIARLARTAVCDRHV
jgi:hypothetical protein